MRLIAGATFHQQRREHTLLSDIRLEECTFDNCSIRGGRLHRLELIDCRAWSCSLNDVVIEDCLVNDLRTVAAGGGGRRSPFFLWGVRTRHVVLTGRIGSLIWNQPKHWARPPTDEQLDAYRRYYDTVDWALDVSRAKFTSVPTLRSGPPGHLISRDQHTQPLVARDRVLAADWDGLKGRVGIWGGVIQRMLESPWPDEIVLVPASADRTYAEELAGIEILRATGVAE
ncbi:MAG TPA: hypothetical protein VF221_13850 [Chloroflexota bacterium]